MNTAKVELFEECRPLLKSVAGRILGSELEVEDILQEACLRWQETDAAIVKSPRAFLITIVTRLCLNQVKLARVRLHEADGASALEQVPASDRRPDELAELADALSEGFRRMLTQLTATERAVFLLREAFDFEFRDIAPVVGRSQENCRQILKRARDRLAQNPGAEPAEAPRQEHVVRLFREAVETGDMDSLLQELSAGAVLVQDGGDLCQVAPEPMTGAALIDELLRQGGRLRAGQAAFSAGLVLGRPAVLARRGREPMGAFLLEIADGQLRKIRLVHCPALLKSLALLMEFTNANNNTHENNTRKN